MPIPYNACISRQLSQLQLRLLLTTSPDTRNSCQFSLSPAPSARHHIDRAIDDDRYRQRLYMSRRSSQDRLLMPLMPPGIYRAAAFTSYLRVSRRHAEATRRSFSIDDISQYFLAELL